MRSESRTHEAKEQEEERRGEKRSTVGLDG
jgi:hypothetical protein